MDTTPPHYHSQLNINPQADLLHHFNFNTSLPMHQNNYPPNNLPRTTYPPNNRSENTLPPNQNNLISQSDIPFQNNISPQTISSQTFPPPQTVPLQNNIFLQHTMSLPPYKPLQTDVPSQNNILPHTPSYTPIPSAPYFSRALSFGIDITR
jgi:hypothetical protein